jgi:hypothetical protein
MTISRAHALTIAKKVSDDLGLNGSHRVHADDVLEVLGEDREPLSLPPLCRYDDEWRSTIESAIRQELP